MAMSCRLLPTASRGRTPIRERISSALPSPLWPMNVPGEQTRLDIHGHRDDPLGSHTEL